MTAKATKRVEVLRTGTFAPMRGAAVTFSADDLKQIAEVYDVTAPAPAVVGHPATDAPAYGWARSFAYDPATDRLTAELGDIEPAFDEAVAQGRYRKISLSLFEPGAPNNPKPGSWYPKHVGFLGAAAPAVPGLKPVQFAGDDTGVVTIEFADATALRDVAGVFRSLREWIIEKFGREAADQAVSDWTIGWIDDAATREPPAPGPAFSEPQPKPETAMPEPTQSAAPSTEDLAGREARLDEREAAINHRDNVAFAEGLIAEGKIIPASQDKLVALLDTLSTSAAQPLTVSFAEGGTQKNSDAATMVRELLTAQPKVVSFGAHDLGEAPGAGVVSFVAGDGAAVDPGRLDLHNRALAYQRAHPSTDYLAAVRAVEAGA